MSEYTVVDGDILEQPPESLVVENAHLRAQLAAAQRLAFIDHKSGLLNERGLAHDYNDFYISELGGLATEGGAQRHGC